MLRRIVSYITLGALVLIAALPLYGMLLPGADHASQNENRNMAEFPSAVPLSEFPADFEAYFNDHFAYRTEILGAYNHLMGMFNGNTDNVVYGKEGWLYYIPEWSLSDITRTQSYSAEQLDTICAAQQDAQDFLASMGIKYILMFCPDKHSIYPEYLPDSLSVGEGESRMECMLRSLREHTNICIVDTRKAVLAEKAQRQVFWKTDTHWNSYGAFVAYGVLADQLEAQLPGFHRLLAQDVEFVEADGTYSGDLARMLGRSDELAEPGLDIHILSAHAYQLDNLSFEEPASEPTRLSKIFVNPANPDGPVGVLFMDSFGYRIVPLLREGFSRLTAVWSTSVLENVVRAESPDVVIMEYVERMSHNARLGMANPEDEDVT